MKITDLKIYDQVTVDSPDYSGVYEVVALNRVSVTLRQLRGDEIVGSVKPEMLKPATMGDHFAQEESWIEP